jgi:hypothetical protein
MGKRAAFAPSIATAPRRPQRRSPAPPAPSTSYPAAEPPNGRPPESARTRCARWHQAIDTKLMVEQVITVRYHCYGSSLSCRSPDATAYVDWHVCTRSGRETHLKRHPSRPLSRGSNTSMSGWRDSNPRPRAPKARALAKLRYSPSRPSITGMSATLLLHREVAGDHKPCLLRL